MAQNLIVGVIVVLALLYLVWYLLPGSARQRLGQADPALGKGKSCGSCSSCTGCGGAAKTNRNPHSNSDGQAVRFYGPK